MSTRDEGLERPIRFYTTADLTRLLSVNASTVKRWADCGKLKCHRTLGGHRRFTYDQVQEFVRAFHLEGLKSFDISMRAEARIP